MPLSSGTRLGPYEVSRPIGAGGMGEVYRARDTRLGREVALKVLPAALAADADYMARFEREAQVLASLNHPNIATIHGIEERDGVRAIAMELVEGQTLEERIQQGPIPLAEALAIARQIAEALEAAHEKGVIHRDLKPANVKVTHEGVVKVLDFGLAKTAGTSTVSGDPVNSPTLTIRATQAGLIMGTAGYMAPEQAAGKPVDKRADIWSFGVVLNEMLTGKRLFDGETIAHTLADVLRAEIDLKQLPADTPPAIRDLVARCLERHVKNRLRDAGEARFAIQKYLADPNPATPAASAPAPGQSRVAWIAAGILLLACLGLAFAYFRRPTEEPLTVKTSLLLPDKGTLLAGSRPAVSPDGRHLAFVAVVEGNARLFVRDLDALAARPLAGTDGANEPFWSPDSRFIGFFAGSKLKKIAVGGGPALSLCDAPAARGGTWNRNDAIVFAPSPNSGLLLVSGAGGNPTPVTMLDQSRLENSHRMPWFLPDGRHFLFTGRSSDPEKTAIFVGDLESKTRRVLFPAASNGVYAPPGLLLFVRERTLMAQPFQAASATAAGDPFPVADQIGYYAPNVEGLFGVSETGVLVYDSSGGSLTAQLTWFDRSGARLGTVGPPGILRSARVAPDAKTVVTDRVDVQAGTSDIWLHELQHGTNSRLTFDRRIAMFPAWSPDGLQVAWVSARSGRWGIYRKPATGAGKEELLVEAPGQILDLDWSCDGRFLVFSLVANQGPDIWMLPEPPGSAGDRKATPFLATEFGELGGRLSPDGKWLAYESNPTGKYEVYVCSFPSKEGMWQVSNNGGDRPVWSRDGKELFYIAADRKLMAVDVKGGAKIEHGIPKPLFETHLASLSQWDVSADGKRFLLIDPLEEGVGPPLTLVLNWHAGAKR